MKTESSKSAKPIALVIPWFGKELTGGAELQAWNIASRLSQRGHSVEVLTTCCKSYTEDWSTNHYEAGDYEEQGGILVRRFEVIQRNRVEFDRVCKTLLETPQEALKAGVSPISQEDEEIFQDHLINSPQLLEYIAGSNNRYSSFFFMPYLYGQILRGLPLVSNRSILIPCLHDESYAYLKATQNAFFKANSILWNSKGEFELGIKLYGPCIIPKSQVVGEGIEVEVNPFEVSSNNFPQPPNQYLLTLGRKDEGKGTHFLVDAFKSFKSSHKSNMSLVLAGPGSENFSDSKFDIIDYGLISEAHKQALLAEMVALAQPSPKESFSRVIFEAWKNSKPVIARTSCLATSWAVRDSEGGWIADSVEEWWQVFETIEKTSESDLNAIGEKGGKYGSDIANWDKSIDRIESALEQCETEVESRTLFTLDFESLANQKLDIYFDDQFVKTIKLTAQQARQERFTVKHTLNKKHQLRFESDYLGGYAPPDRRLLGFRLNSCQIENDNNANTPYLQYKQGWNRADDHHNPKGPRWSTGSANIVISFRSSKAKQRVIHQALPNLSSGDAIGNHVLWIRDQLQALGYHSEVFARHLEDSILNEAYAYYKPEILSNEDSVIYHHSIGSEITPWLCDHNGPKALIYHNITPPRFFEPYSKTFAQYLKNGIDELKLIAKHFDSNFGVSQFNASQLAEADFNEPKVFPIGIDPQRWSSAPDEEVIKKYDDGRTNLLYVGRIVPNKRIEDVLYTFKFWLEDDPTARLLLVGGLEVDSKYPACLRILSKKLRIDHAVTFVGRVTDSELQSFFRCASMYWSFSEHEGFCVPLIEAMWFDVPVVAYNCTAIGETLDCSGILIDEKNRPDLVAKAVKEMFDDKQLLQELIAKQRKRRKDFLPEALKQKIEELIESLNLQDDKRK